MSDERDLRKGSAELLILSLLDERERHGYELAKLIERRSSGALVFHVASLYPVLYRLERRGLIQGRWVEKPGERRRRFYRVTAEGSRTLAAQRRSWSAFFAALNRVARLRRA
jgi:transcriptional regulator